MSEEEDYELREFKKACAVAEKMNLLALANFMNQPVTEVLQWDELTVEAAWEYGARLDGKQNWGDRSTDV